MMVKKRTSDNPQAKQQMVTAVTRTYEPEKFEADMDEERLIAVLAERRRQFLSMLKAREPQPDEENARRNCGGRFCCRKQLMVQSLSCSTHNAIASSLSHRLVCFTGILIMLLTADAGRSLISRLIKSQRCSRVLNRSARIEIAEVEDLGGYYGSSFFSHLNCGRCIGSGLAFWPSHSRGSCRDDDELHAAARGSKDYSGY